MFWEGEGNPDLANEPHLRQRYCVSRCVLRVKKDLEDFLKQPQWRRAISEWPVIRPKHYAFLCV